METPTSLTGYSRGEQLLNIHAGTEEVQQFKKSLAQYINYIDELSRVPGCQPTLKMAGFNAISHLVQGDILADLLLMAANKL